MDSPSELEERIAAARLDDDARLEAMVRARLFGSADAPAARIGRFTLLERIGRGGAGDVYAAYDPLLDRKVALKILRTDVGVGVGVGDLDPDERSSLLKEARAAGRLAHPGVVAIHEVGEVGGEAGGIYLAMEFVDGQTLRAWLREPRAPAAILRVFVDAGLALAAAHDAGIIHRDFKPENLLISGAGPALRGQVVDFGLARSSEPRAAGPGSPAARQSTAAGTPAYMSPEQLRGQPVDARSDLFAFCVALHEALTGRHPFGADEAGATAVGLLARIAEGARSPGERALPGWLRPILRRGLSPTPAERYPSMHALLRDLRATPARRRRRALGAGVVVVALASSALTFAGQGGLGRACVDVEAELAGVWDEPLRAAARRALAAADLVDADDAWARLEGRIEEYARAWAASRARACEGPLPVDLQALRDGCLGRRKAELAGLTERLREADASTIHGALVALDALTPITVCDDVEGLRREAAPRGRRVAQIAEATRLEILRRTTQARAGGARELAPLADALLLTAREFAAPVVIAEAHVLRSVIEEAAGDYDAAATSLEAAVHEAIAGRHDRLHAEAATRLVWLHGVRRRDRAAALAWVDHAAAAIRAIAGDPRLEARLLDHRGALAARNHDLAEAIRLQREAIAILRRLAPLAAAELGSGVGNLGISLLASGEVEAATPLIEESLARLREARGPGHPDVAVMLSNLGVAYVDAGDPERGAALLREALTLKEAAMGADHVGLLPTLVHLGAAASALGRGEEARARLGRARAIGEAAYGPESPHLEGILHNLAFESWLIGDHAAVIRESSAALAVQRRIYGDEHPILALTLELRARGELGIGDPAAAGRTIDQALALAEGGELQAGERGNLLLTAALVRRAGGAPAALIHALAREAKALLGDPDDPQTARELAAVLAP